MNVEKVRGQIIQLLDDAQRTSATHQKGVQSMKKLLQQSGEDIFFKAFEMPLQEILSTDMQSNPNVERLTEFVAIFCSALESKQINLNDTVESEEHPFLTKLFDYLLIAQQNVLDEVRYRACQLINKLLNHLVGVEVSVQLCDKIEEHLLERVKDTKSVIRAQAVIALHRLQDTSNPEDKIIAEFVKLFSSDPFAKVRELCVEKVALRKDTIVHLLSRTRDVSSNVRLATFKRLTKVVNSLKIVERRLILNCGFVDTSAQVKKYIEDTLLPEWIDHYDSILSFMKSIRLDADENDIEKTTILVEMILPIYFKMKPLSELTEVLPLNENKLIPIDLLGWETVSYWRFYVEFLNQSEQYENELNRVIPELVHFCRYIELFIESCPTNVTRHQFLKQQFILKQLFIITKTYDVADPSGRQSLNRLIIKTLEKYVLMKDVVQEIINSLELIIPNGAKRSLVVSEIISEIMYPMNEEESQRLENERHFEISKIKVRLNSLSGEQEQAIINENFTEAAQLKEQIAALQNQLKDLLQEKEIEQKIVKRTDVPTIIKYLDIACSLLQSPQIREMNGTILSLQNNVILESLIHENETVRAKALRCYALCCIIDKNSAKNGIHIFSTPIFAYERGEECDTQTLEVCIAAVIDLIRIYGSQLMAEPAENQLSESTDEEHERIFTGGTSLTDLIQGLVDLMDDENMEIQLLAVRGLCSLIYSERVESASLLSRLILKWGSPAPDDDIQAALLRQLIGKTLNEIPFFNNNSDQLEGAVILTVKALVYAPKGSPLADVNVDKMIKFMLALCDSSNQGEYVHYNLATKLCCALIDKPTSRLVPTYTKMLSMLKIPSNPNKIHELLCLCDKVRDVLEDRASITNLVKYIAMLSQKVMAEVKSEDPTESSAGL